MAIGEIMQNGEEVIAECSAQQGRSLFTWKHTKSAIYEFERIDELIFIPTPDGTKGTLYDLR